jgi:hypothetical protein
MKGKTSKLLMLTLTLTLALILVTPVLAMEPLRGTMDLTFNLAWSGPSETIHEWNGSITIGDDVYFMEFFNIGTGKQGDQDPGMTLHFGEIWKIWEDEERDNLLLNGTDEGVVSLANSEYRMNGVVTVAYGDFVIWEGRNVHMSGIIEWYPFGAPHFAPGIFRIN